MKSLVIGQKRFSAAAAERLMWVLLALLLTAFLPLSAFAYDGGPPEFVFNDRCVPYEVDPDFMRANGVDPDKIISAFVEGGDGVNPDIPGDVTGTGNNGSVSPWMEDFEEDGVTPKPCDEFHTHRRRTRYEGCHFYDGTPCYFMTTGQLDHDSFTPDEAGRRAFEIAEHFVFYEFTQKFQQGNPTIPPWEAGYTPAPIFTDPFCCGFAVGAQTKLMNADGAYWVDDPIGLWKDSLVNFNAKAQACLNDFVDADCVFMHEMVVANGENNQQAGYPLVYTGEELFELSDRNLISIRYREGGDGGLGTQGSARYIMCPLHENPVSDDLSEGNDIIQGYPMHFEWQPPSLFIVQPVGARGSDTIVVDPLTDNLFGPTPPPGAGPFAEQLIEDNFHCLQRTGQWCP
ncbi:MAG: hypothetical protein ACR2P6_05755 [Gammaproteobacteria bacterium]